MAFEELKQRQSVVWGSGPYEPIVHITAEIHERLVAALAPQPGEQLLDVATGTGVVAVRAASEGAAVTGVDLAPNLVESQYSFNSDSSSMSLSSLKMSPTLMPMRNWTRLFAGTSALRSTMPR